MAYLAVACNSSIHVYRCGSDDYEHVAILENDPPSDRVNVHSFDRDNCSVIGACDDCLFVWDTSCLAGLESTLPMTIVAGDRSRIRLACGCIGEVLFSISGDRLLVTSANRENMVLLDWTNRTEVWRLSHLAHTKGPVLFARQDELLMYAKPSSKGIALQILDAATGSEAVNICLPEPNWISGYLPLLALHPTDPYAAVAILLDVAIVCLGPEYLSFASTEPAVKLQAHSADVRSIQFSNAGTKLVSASLSEVFVWDALTWEIVVTIPAVIDIGKLIYHSNMNHLAFNSLFDDYVRVYDGKSGQMIATLDCDKKMCFSTSSSVVLM
jgi:WD40 repeat protein